MAQVRTPKAKPKSVEHPESMSLDAYRDLVHRVMLDATSKNTRMARVFTNTGTEHARIVLEAMLGSATSSVEISCRELSIGVWSSKWFEDLLDRAPQADIRVLVENGADITLPQSALHTLQKQILHQTIKVKRLHNPTNSSPMTIVDGRHLRAETNHGEKKAVVSFGDEDIGGIASKVFDTLWKAAVPL